MKEHTTFWNTFTKDPWVLNSISGLKIQLKSQVFQNSLPKEIQFSPCEEELIENELQSLLQKSVIMEIDPTPQKDEFISNIFIRPKKNGGIRLILNLKSFNKNVVTHHFKLQSLQSAIDLMTKNAFMTSVDFSDAYYSVPIRESDQKYLRFQYKGKRYQYLVLPNGLSSGPRDFTKITKALFGYLREIGYQNTFYIDDSFLIEISFQRCFDNMMATVDYSTKAGFVVNPDKSVLWPTQILTYLGFILNTLDMTVRPTKEKTEKIKKLITSCLLKKDFTIQSIAELVGKLVALFPGVTHAKLFYRQLDIEKSAALKLSRGNYEATMQISAEARQDLHWFLDNLDGAFVDVSVKNPDFVLKTDASNSGWGGILQCSNSSTTISQTRGQWTNAEKGLHINLKELLAVRYTLESLCCDTYGVTINVCSDNSTTVSYIKNQGGKIESCHKITKQIWLWAIHRHIWLLSSFIPGVQNVEADRLSRTLTPNTEWSLLEHHFSKVQALYPDINFDLFASRLNAKLPRYASWYPDPSASICDAFTFDWSTICAYAFPPFSLIGRVLQKVQEDKCDLILLVPFWPRQYWFSKLTSMLIDFPYSFPKGKAVFNPLPSDTEEVRAKFMLTKISGSTYKTRMFRERLEKSLCSPGENQPENSIDLSTNVGNIFVRKDLKIPLKPI